MELTSRPANQSDQPHLEAFVCTSADPRVQSWINRDALTWSTASAEHDDARLVLFHLGTELVAVAAHRRNYEVSGPDGGPVPGTYLMLVAVTDSHRGTPPQADDLPIVASVTSTTLADIRSRDRGPWLSMMVHRDNEAGRRVVDRLRAERVGDRGDDDVFVMRLSASNESTVNDS